LVVPARLARDADLGVAMPLSVIPTFFFMQWLGFTLNLITLLGLSLVVGILVDDAIVEVENIVRHMRMGKTRVAGGDRRRRRDRPGGRGDDARDRRGVRAGQLHVRRAGQFFRQFGISVAIAVADLAAGGAADHAGDGRLPAQAATATSRKTAR
jgi:hypothetical protein